VSEELRDRFRQHWLEILDVVPLKTMKKATLGVFDPDAWKAEVFSAVETIASEPRHEPRGALRRKLARVASDARRLMAAMEGLPPRERLRLRLDALELDRVARESDRRADALEVPRRSGGSAEARAGRARKALAAELAFDLLIGICLPSLSVGGT